MSRRPRRAALALFLVLCMSLQFFVGVSEAHADSSPIRGLGKDAHPVVLIHGWTGTPLQDTRALLEKSMGKGWQFLLFDYTADNTLWVGDPKIELKLANYIKDVSAAHKRIGGDGLIYLVGHSMGGLAIRFASTQPGVAAVIGGVVTVGTPHQGSPWGNAASGVWGKLREVTSGKVFDPPDASSLARICLATQHQGRRLPDGCAAPPYLPAGIPLQQIAGSVILERKYFGFHAYDITIGGDSIVPQDSAEGYLGSAAGKSPTGSFAPIPITCRIPESSLWSVGLSPVAVPWQLFTDSGMMDQLMSDKVGVSVALVLGRIFMVKDSCAHGAMMTNSAVVTQIATSLKTLAAKRAAETVPTELITVNPFTATSALKPGYTVKPDEDNVSLDCSLGEPSPAGVTANTHWCSGLASDGGAFCWADPTRNDSVLCAFDAENKELYRYYATGIGRTPVAAQPEPMNVELVDGSKWSYRTGGSWSGGPDDTYGTYWCVTKCPGNRALVANESLPTFVKKNGVWMARVGQLGENPDSLPSPRLVRVKRAWFIAAP